MKKFIVAFMIVSLSVSLGACGNEKSQNSQEKTPIASSKIV